MHTLAKLVGAVMLIVSEKKKRSSDFFLQRPTNTVVGLAIFLLYISLVSADREFVILPHMPDDLPRPA